MNICPRPPYKVRTGCFMTVLLPAPVFTQHPEQSQDSPLWMEKEMSLLATTLAKYFDIFSSQKRRIHKRVILFNQSGGLLRPSLLFPVTFQNIACRSTLPSLKPSSVLVNRSLHLIVVCYQCILVIKCLDSSLVDHIAGSLPPMYWLMAHV